LISSVIIAACCIHNFVIDIDGIDDEDFVGVEEEADANYLVVDHEPLLGQIKRNLIASMLL
jgi:hypothetical protein